MENNSKKIKSKKSEIKAIINDFRKIIETYVSNHDEKPVNTLKNTLKNKKIFGVMKKMIILKI